MSVLDHAHTCAHSHKHTHTRKYTRLHAHTSTKKHHHHTLTHTHTHTHEPKNRGSHQTTRWNSAAISLGELKLAPSTENWLPVRRLTREDSPDLFVIVPRCTSRRGPAYQAALISVGCSGSARLQILFIFAGAVLLQAGWGQLLASQSVPLYESR